MIGLMLVRRATEADSEAIRAVHAAAFAGGGTDRLPGEVTLLDALVAAGDLVPALSLVATTNGEIVGHVACSTATVAEYRVVALGPIGVLPAHQRRGVGRALMHAALGAADALDVPLVGLLGSPTYYGRFGFVPSTSLGIEPPDPAWREHFQVRPLSAYDARIRGRFRYAAAFTAT
ncbi:MAG: GNAT family N-acetyltransferase [Gaiellaceae bacterium]